MLKLSEEEEVFGTKRIITILLLLENDNLFFLRNALIKVLNYNAADISFNDTKMKHCYFLLFETPSKESQH